MEDSHKIIYLAFSIIFFCICAFFLIYHFRTYTKTISAYREIVKEDEVYEKASDVDGSVTYGEIIATLLKPLKYDIRINDVDIDKDEYDVSMLPSYPIPYSNYHKDYEYDADGELARIVYTAIP